MRIEDVCEQACRIFDRHDLLMAHLEGRQIFPLKLSIKRMSSGDLTKNFSLYREQFAQLQQDCHAHRLSLEYSSVKNRQLGDQLLPREVIFPTEDVFLSFIGKTDEHQTRIKTANLISEKNPSLKSFVIKYPQKMIAHLSCWPSLLAVSEHFLVNEKPNQHVRQLEIPGIDTKFVEDNKRILLDLDLWIKAHDQEQKTVRVSTENFEGHFGLCKEEPRLRFRLLDHQSAHLFGGLQDIEAPASQIAKTEIPCDLVFIVENKTTGLLLPDKASSMVFFELGYKANLLKEISWLKNKKIIYWGDIDTHGFAILSQLRAHFPHIESNLMDEKTLLKYEHLWSFEGQPYMGECPHLSFDESLVFESLRSRKWGSNVRLEQERIPLAALY